MSASRHTDHLTEFKNLFTLKMQDWDNKESEQQQRIDFYTKELQLAADRERAHLANSTTAKVYFTDLTTYI